VIFWFAFYAIIEVGMNLFFDESAPLWKTISISLITSLCTCYVLYRKNKNLRLNDLLTYQNKEIFLLKEIDDEFNVRLAQRLVENGYLLMNSSPNEIKFKSKSSFSSFGEIYKIVFLNEKIIINSRPKLPTNFINEDAKVAERINELEFIIHQNYL
jgi:hypothetical protein